MERPEFITEEDIKRWSENMEKDENLPKHILKIEPIKEICFAGMFLVEQLQKINCPPDLIVRMQYTAGKLSFGRNTWEVSQMILEKFKNNDLIFEEDIDDNN